ncbi:MULTISPECIES: arylamine N-acetyltransferase family protein [Streptomyces]|jgi:N-hydroxyarylamine O-acetyltransferase|uniref:arylamine N-acetyltransferase family protein n=1 Tax=Streptomyces TaxID=1883 RepID=UPI000BB15B26|nr:MULTISPECIES: arylamine N-acetyltransferase [Streptomyces]MCX4433789.1 arylamine N-acetyltransferase [Streptomyces mirabilis]PBC99104.1 N-hydroxyarylamine O-acetyltransferase [Streptomyces sp. Ag82_O1-15]SOE75232.1 N-hydroxyarylamine O-acetyltransferase [Streptomyces sp. OV198]
MNSAQADAYLRRIGAHHPAWPTSGVLRDLHLRHLKAVPFENLSIHLGEEIVLEEKRLLDKVVGGRRGGFCYELNGAFGALLGALGFDVTLLAGRVYGEEGRLGIPYDHLALRVRTVDGGDWLADVGFGAHSHYPLAFGARTEQVDPGGTFRVLEAGPDAAGVRGVGGRREAEDLDVIRDGGPQYRLEVRPRVLGDFAAGAWWNSTSPKSHFTRSLVCSRVTEAGGRITLSGRNLTATAPDGTKEVSELATDEEVLALYRERFGIELDRVPEVRKG